MLAGIGIDKVFSQTGKVHDAKKLLQEMLQGGEKSMTLIESLAAKCSGRENQPVLERALAYVASVMEGTFKERMQSIICGMHVLEYSFTMLLHLLVDEIVVALTDPVGTGIMEMVMNKLRKENAAKSAPRRSTRKEGASEPESEQPVIDKAFVREELFRQANHFFSHDHLTNSMKYLMRLIVRQLKEDGSLPFQSSSQDHNVYLVLNGPLIRAYQRFLGNMPSQASIVAMLNNDELEEPLAKKFRELVAMFFKSHPIDYLNPKKQEGSEFSLHFLDEDCVHLLETLVQSRVGPNLLEFLKRTRKGEDETFLRALLGLEDESAVSRVQLSSTFTATMGNPDLSVSGLGSARLDWGWKILVSDNCNAYVKGVPSMEARRPEEILNGAHVVVLFAPVAFPWNSPQNALLRMLCFEAIKRSRKKGDVKPYAVMIFSGQRSGAELDIYNLQIKAKIEVKEEYPLIGGENLESDASRIVTVARVLGLDGEKRNKIMRKALELGVTTVTVADLDSVDNLDMNVIDMDIEVDAEAACFDWNAPKPGLSDGKGMIDAVTGTPKSAEFYYDIAFGPGGQAARAVQAALAGDLQPFFELNRPVATDIYGLDGLKVDETAVLFIGECDHEKEEEEEEEEEEEVEFGFSNGSGRSNTFMSAGDRVSARIVRRMAFYGLGSLAHVFAVNALPYNRQLPAHAASCKHYKKVAGSKHVPPGPPSSDCQQKCHELWATSTAYLGLLLAEQAAKLSAKFKGVKMVPMGRSGRNISSGINHFLHLFKEARWEGVVWLKSDVRCVHPVAPLRASTIAKFRSSMLSLQKTFEFVSDRTISSMEFEKMLTLVSDDFALATKLASLDQQLLLRAQSCKRSVTVHLDKLREISGQQALDFGQSPFLCLVLRYCVREARRSDDDLLSKPPGDFDVPSESMDIEAAVQHGRGGHCVITDADLKAQADQCRRALEGFLSAPLEKVVNESLHALLQVAMNSIQNGSTSRLRILQNMKSKVFTYLKKWRSTHCQLGSGKVLCLRFGWIDLAVRQVLSGADDLQLDQKIGEKMYAHLSVRDAPVKPVEPTKALMKFEENMATNWEYFQVHEDQGEFDLKLVPGDSKMQCALKFQLFSVAGLREFLAAGSKEIIARLSKDMSAEGMSAEGESEDQKLRDGAGTRCLLAFMNAGLLKLKAKGSRLEGMKLADLEGDLLRLKASAFAVAGKAVLNRKMVKGLLNLATLLPKRSLSHVDDVVLQCDGHRVRVVRWAISDDAGKMSTENPSDVSTVPEALDGNVMYGGVDLGSQKHHGGVAPPIWIEALKGEEEDDDEKPTGKGFTITVGEFETFTRSGESAKARASELKQVSGIFQQSVEAMEMDRIKVCALNVPLDKAVKSSFRYLLPLIFAHNGHEAVTWRRRSEILSRQFVTRIAQRAFVEAPAAAAKAKEDGNKFPQSHLRMTSKRGAKRAKKKRKKTHWTKKKRKPRKRMKEGEGEEAATEQVEANTVQLPYNHLVFGFDLSRSSRLPGNDLVRSLARVARSGQFRGKVHVFTAKAFRTTKQADPASTLISGQREDRRKPTPNDVAAAKVANMPKNCFDQLFDPVTCKLVQRDGDVHLAIASEGYAWVSKNQKLIKRRDHLYSAASTPNTSPSQRGRPQEQKGAPSGVPP